MATNRDCRSPSQGSCAAVRERELDERPTSDEVERRLQELSDLHELGKSLRETRFVERPREPDADRVRERPDERSGRLRASFWSASRPSC